MSTLIQNRDTLVQAGTVFGLVAITIALVAVGLLASSGVLQAAS